MARRRRRRRKTRDGRGTALAVQQRREDHLELVRGADGALYIGDVSETVSDSDDEGYVGGGHRLGAPRRVTTADGEEREVREIITLAAGGPAAMQGAPLPYREPPEDRPEQLEWGYRLWKHDPLGGAIVNLTTQFTFGRGLRIQAAGVAEKVLRKFWKKNGLGRRSKVLCDEASAFGEVFVKLIVHAEDVAHPANPDRSLWRAGQIEFVPIAPEVVQGINHNPANIDDVSEYLLRYAVREGGGRTGGRKKEITERLPPLDKFDATRHKAALVHLKFNAASNDLFGFSELVRLREWLNNYKEFLRDGVLINRLYRSPCYDITIIDGDDRDVRRAIRRYQNWEIGANPVHNDKEKWQILEFTGANVSQEASRRALLLIVAAGAGLPEYMLADGANANLASARAQQLPAVKKFEAMQEAFKWFWERIFTFVLDVADAIGEVEDLEPDLDFEGDPVWTVEAKFPPILAEKDFDIANANRLAIEDGYMSPQTAAARAGLDYEQELELGRQAARDREVQKLQLEAFIQGEDFKTMRSELLGPEEGRFEVGGDDDPEEIEQPLAIEDGGGEA